jgi:hypothetical protein
VLPQHSAPSFPVHAAPPRLAQERRYRE